MYELNKLLNKANELFARKQYRKAISVYEEILSVDPLNLSAINNQGYALSKSKNYEAAVEVYEKGGTGDFEPTNLFVYAGVFQKDRSRSHRPDLENWIPLESNLGV